MNKIGIVSGLPRSGTSMMMNILYRGGVPVAFNNSRKTNQFNLKGFFELYGGKIINKLEKGEIDFNQLKGKFTKIINYGLKYLVKNDYNYKVIYMVRDRDELFMSFENMTKRKTDEKERRAFIQLDKECIDLLKNRKNIEYIILDYNTILQNPQSELEKIANFLNEFDFNIEEAKKAIDPSLKTF